MELRGSDDYKDEMKATRNEVRIVWLGMMQCASAPRRCKVPMKFVSNPMDCSMSMIYIASFV